MPTSVPDRAKPVAPQGGEIYRAGRPTLGARLLAAAQLVRPGCTVADIGCDHGKLAAHLVLAGIAPRVIAIDQRPLPLARAKALAGQCGISDKMDCRLGSGLAPLDSGEATEIVVAGVSGQTIIEILSGAGWVKSSEVGLVLVPATRHPQLRHWLCENGFFIQREIPSAENGRFYTAIAARFTGEQQSPSPLFCQLGLVPQAPGEAARGYIAARLAHLKKQARANLDEEQRAALQKLTSEVQACL